MTPPPATIERLASPAEAIVRRIGGPIEALDGAVTTSVGWLGPLSAVPPAITIAALALIVWRGREVRRGITIVVALHLVMLSGSWSVMIDTLATGAVLGALGLGVSIPLMFASARRESAKTARKAGPLVVAFAVVVSLSLLPLLTTSDRAPWGVVGVLVAMGLLGIERLGEPSPTSSPRSAFMALRAGIAAALLVGLLSGDGLGGLVARAAFTGDIGLAIQLLLALAGLGTALGSATGITRGVPADRPSANHDPDRASGSRSYAL